MRQFFTKQFLILASFLFIFAVNAFQNDRPIFEYDYSYREVTETSGATSYIFEGEAKPPLMLSDTGSIYKLSDVNDILSAVGLPPVIYVVPELESITGERFNRGEYEWENYELGILRIRRTICERTEKTQGFWASLRAITEDYDCAWKVTVR